MGTFGGHAYLGPPYVLLGMWYIVQSLRRLYQSRIKGEKFVSSMGYPADFFKGRYKNLPIDSIFKVVFPLCYMSVEITYAYTQKAPEESHMNNWQHVTISVPIVFSGATELMVHYGVPIIPGWDYAANGLLFLVEMMTFYFHLHGSILEVRLHILYILIVIMGLASVLIESRKRGHVMLPIIRGTSLVLTGTWMTEIGFILYNPWGPTWDETKHMNLTLATIHFSWHLISCMLLSMGVSVFVAMGYRKKGYVLGSISHVSSTHLSVKMKGLDQARTPCLYDVSDQEQD